MRRPWQGTGALALALFVWSACGVDRRVQRPDVFVISLDTLRRDAVGAFAEDGPSLTPSLDELARDSVLFRAASAPVPYTLSSHMSLFTGLYPMTHGVTDLDRRLDQRISTLGELISGSGYHSVGVVTNGHLLAEFGFGRGFQQYDFLEHRMTYADRVNGAALHALAEAPKERPLFLFLHYQDVHSDAHHVAGRCFPYFSPEEFRDSLDLPEDAFHDREGRCATDLLVAADREGRRLDPHLEKAIRSLYLSGVRYLDHELGLFFQELKAQGRYDNALIIVVSDHGEGLGDHGRFIHSQPYEEDVGVPLLIKFPNSQYGGETLSEVVELVDILPTLGEILGFGVPENIQGESLIPLVDGRGRDKSHALSQDKQRSHRFGFRKGRYKLVHDGARQETQLFDLVADPGEQQDLAPGREDLTRDLLVDLTRLVGAAESAGREFAESSQGESPLDEEERRHLEALGYVDTRPNILIIMWDTVRPDRMGCYGYSKPTTPNVDRFGEQARVFDRAISSSNWTVPSHASLFTGLHPDTHLAVGSKGRLHDRFDTLAERLSRAGYETYAFSANPFVSRKFNLVQGFQKVEHPWTGRWPKRVRSILEKRPDRGRVQGDKEFPRKEAGPVAVEALLEWLDGRESSKPFFAFLNLMEAHWPWHPTRSERLLFMDKELVEHSYEMDLSFGARWAWSFGVGHYSDADLAATSGLYDASIRRLDEVTGVLLGSLQERHLEASTAVVLLSDHGENLGDHGLLGHEYSLHDSLVRVPLLIRYPQLFAPGREAVPVQLLDLYPTVLELAGLKQGQVPGQSLVSRNSAFSRQRPLLSAYLMPKSAALEVVARRFPQLDSTPWKSPIRSVEVDGWKLIRWDDGRRELYHLAQRPDESLNLAGSQPERLTALEELLERFLEESAGRLGEPSQEISEDMLDPEIESQLEALGYIN
jgi:arylsulfatase A-like enzyme